MNALALTLVLAWRDPARNLALMIGLFAVLIFIVLAPYAGFWVTLLIGPAFLISTNLSVPTFSAFERSMPVTVPQLVWSRVLASLGPIWISLLLGVLLMLLTGQQLSVARQPVECAAFFTAAVCLTTLARLSATRMTERIWSLLALAAAILTLLYLTPTAAFILTSAVLVPVAAKFWWTYAPEWERHDTRPAVGNALRPLLRMVWPWRTLVIIPLAAWLGLDSSWSLLPFAGLFLGHLTVQHPYLLGLPISRRHILWAILAPVIVPYLIGSAFSPRFQGPDRIANFTQPSPKSSWREFYGNPPGLTVPLYYFQTYETQQTPPRIVAPWGESAQPTPSTATYNGGSYQVTYDPYWVGPENTDRFFEWQFARATRTIYGKPFTPPQLRVALRAGLRPVTEQPRAQVVRMAFGTALLLTLGLLSALSNWYRLRAVPRRLRALLPFWLPMIALIVAATLAPMLLLTFVPRLLVGLSALLPSNFALMTLVLLAALVPLCWALETVFQEIEFSDKSKETA